MFDMEKTWTLGRDIGYLLLNPPPYAGEARGGKLVFYKRNIWKFMNKP